MVFCSHLVSLMAGFIESPMKQLGLFNGFNSSNVFNDYEITCFQKLLRFVRFNGCVRLFYVINDWSHDWFSDVAI